VPHYLVECFYKDRPFGGDTFTLVASSEAEAIKEARVYGPLATPPPTHCILYRVTRGGRTVLWDSRKDEVDGKRS
jgi:hypothetical protein